MDKNYNKIICKIIVVVCIGCFMCWGIKDYIHKREIHRLLLVKPETNYVQVKEEKTVSKAKDFTVKGVELNYAIENDKSEPKKEMNNEETQIENDTELSSDNNLDNKKIYNSSRNVEQKEKSGADFMNTLVLEDSNTSLQVSELINSKENNLDNLHLLARLIQSEAGQEPYDGKIAVGNVVLNRARENNQSIESVIYAKNQFDGVKTDNFNKNPNEESVNAAKEVLNGREVIDNNSYYFVNLEMASPSWAKENTFVTRIGEHWFFRKE